MVKDKVVKLRDEFREKLDQTNQDDTNWSPFTYRFAFLLGKKRYFKKVLPLENIIVKNYLSDKGRTDFLQDLKTKIIKNQTIVDSMNSSNTNKIVEALDKIELLIATNYNDFQFRIFNAFDRKIADLIDSY